MSALEQLRDQVDRLITDAHSLEGALTDELARVAPEARGSAANLVHYLAVRQHDVRPLQRRLARCGLSSLGFLESHVLASLESVAANLACRDGELRLDDPTGHAAGFDGAEAVLLRNTRAILGPEPRDRSVRIMVTMPTEAGADPRYIESLLAQGMDIMRVNCAHDGREVWDAMVSHLRRAERKLGRRCLLAFDLGGPKLRTAAIEPGPEVRRFRPERNELGQVVASAAVRLTVNPAAESPAPGEVTIPIDPPMLRAMRPGDVVRLTDARGRRRELAVRVLTETSGLCESSRTGYVTSGMPLEVTRGGRRVHVGEVGHLEARARSLLLAAGDSLVITRDGLPGRPATCDELGRVIEPARIGCTLPEVFSAVGPGQRILLDDGKFEGLIRTTQPDRFQVELYRVGGGTARLRAEKGINLPDTRLDLSAITDKDRADLEFVARHADLVSVSFVRHPDDVEELHRELERLGAGNVGIVLKIEKGQAFEHLPRLLLAALRRPPVAVMLARGDLAVEVGFERLAEVQEEILWLCEAAHVPVIWATQVLESLAKSGIPSRGEVTDAAMSGRAECVMLNKGPYIGEAVRFLDDVLRRMRDHHVKRVATLRKLKVAGDYPLPRRPRPAAMPLQA